MASRSLILVVLLICPSLSQYTYEEDILYDYFPDGFMWGTTTSAYQIEGARNADGASPTIWDEYFLDHPSADGTDGSVTCDSYYKYREDVQLIKDMGLSHYKFSIAWTRIIPDGVGEVNQAGINHYNDVIDELLANGIQPFATLYHWDLPQVLEDMGGWRNESIKDWFESYARVCFEAFGDRVKLWSTINEPIAVSVLGYGTGYHAPGLTEIGTYPYEVTHNILKAHAKAYRAYQADFAAAQGGRVGITLDAVWLEPQDPSDPNHLEASDIGMEFYVGWFAKPIFGDGRYPDVMRQKVDEKSALQGFPESRLPEFTAEESLEIAGSADFLSFNHYSTNGVYPEPSDINVVSYYEDDDVTTYVDQSFYMSGSSWLVVAPFGIRKALNWINNHYAPGEIIVTENGFSDNQGNLDDIHRIYVFKHYINEVLRAIKEDGINVTGYFAWSLLDNLEWGAGVREKLGMHYVDFDDPDRPRTPKESSKYLRDLAAANGFVPSSGPCSNR